MSKVDEPGQATFKYSHSYEAFRIRGVGFKGLLSSSETPSGLIYISLIQVLGVQNEKRRFPRQLQAGSCDIKLL